VQYRDSSILEKFRTSRNSVQQQLTDSKFWKMPFFFAPCWLLRSKTRYLSSMVDDLDIFTNSIHLPRLQLAIQIHLINFQSLVNLSWRLCIYHSVLFIWVKFFFTSSNRNYSTYWIPWFSYYQESFDNFCDFYTNVCYALT